MHLTLHLLICFSSPEQKAWLRTFSKATQSKTRWRSMSCQPGRKIYLRQRSFRDHYNHEIRYLMCDCVRGFIPDPSYYILFQPSALGLPPSHSHLPSWTIKSSCCSFNIQSEENQTHFRNSIFKKSATPTSPLKPCQVLLHIEPGQDFHWFQCRMHISHSFVRCSAIFKTISLRGFGICRVHNNLCM